MARIAFFGTPALAATCATAVAEACAAGAHQLVLGVCQRDKPVGRGHKLEAPPVKRALQALQIPVLQPATLKKGTDDGDAFFDAFTAENIDLAIVVAYGRILPQRLLDLPRRGFVNVHASLLPRWRGAAPIQRAIEAGDTETGVCLMDMVKELDAGDVFAEAKFAIADDDTGETLADKVGAAGAALLRTHLDDLIEGRLTKTPQPAEGITYAEMLRKDEGVVDFNRDAKAVYDRCRAFVPWPGSQTTHGDEVIKLFAPSLTDIDTTGVVPGVIVGVDPHAGVQFACRDRAIAFARVQRPNKGPVSASQWAQAVGLGGMKP
jgi:methionyl-tRNA formyltransferase